MSILHDEGQRAIAEGARKVLAAGADNAKMLAGLDTPGQVDPAFWKTVVEQGWTALAVPEAHGGLGLSLVELGLVAQACGGVVAAAPWLTGSSAVVRALVAGDDDAARQRWLPALAGGTVRGCVAFGEGSAILPTAPAVRLDGGTLTGTKPAVTGGLDAELALVWAADGGEPVLALAELANLKRAPLASFDNARLHADLALAGTPATVLARGEAARRLVLDVLAAMAVVTAHEQIGGAEALLYIARDYALTRRAFGQPIGAFQSIKHRLAELYGLIEIARANAIHAAASDGQPGFVLAAADARLSAIEAYDTAARDGVQVHGAIGVTWELGLHLHMRRARSLAIEAGSSMFWEDVLVNELTREAA